jgi:hypothetical protein
VDDEEAWRVRQASEEIRAYLRENPRGADSLDGVASFWVRSDLYGGSPDIVERALDLLTTAGFVTQDVLPDGRILYRATVAPERS